MRKHIIKPIGNNIIDLFNLTRSCEGDSASDPIIFNNLDYKNYKHGINVPTCGHCFWCQERNWAVKQNDL